MSVPDLHTPIAVNTAGVSSGGTLENIRIAYGSTLAKELINFEFSHHESAPIDDTSSMQGLNVTVSGKISNANYSHKKAIYIFFINNRLVECSAIKKTIETVYSDILPRHSFPFVYLSLRYSSHFSHSLILYTLY
jgi:DNA mismatch repair protein MLH1